MDLGIEVPNCEELGSVTTNAMWNEIYDRLTTLAQEHRSTLVFVNTRRWWSDCRTRSVSGLVRKMSQLTTAAFLKIAIGGRNTSEEG